MYINDIINDFYVKLIGKKVLVLANCDIDSACTCKILQSLFQCDNIVYTLIPVLGVQDMISAFEEHASEVKCVILVNCGGTLDILEILQPEADVVFYIIDSHRPSDVCNIYNNDQIFIVPKPGDEEIIPDFDDIFGNEDVEEEGSEGEEEGGNSEDEGGESRAAKRQRLNESTILRRRERRLWEDKRNRLMFDYTQFTYYGRCSAILMYELAWKLSKDNIDLLWWAIVGVSSQLVLSQVTRERYQEEIGSLTLHIGRLCPGTADEDSGSLQTTTGVPTAYTTATRITAAKDLALVLYRHWTVEQSLRHSTLTAVRLKLWTIRGEKRLQSLLAEMGLPLAESKQMFGSMDLSLRKQFHNMMDKMADTHQLDHVVFSSFTLHHGCRHRYQAVDFVYALLALLNPNTKDVHFNDCFQDALACLSRQHRPVLEEGIERAKKLLTVIYRQTHNILDMKQIASAGPFLYFVLQEGNLDTRFLTEPLCLCMLAHVCLRAYVASSHKKASGLPLVISVPLHLTEDECMIVGVPPVAEAVPRNFFGKAFEQAAEKTNSRLDMDFFDTSVVRLKTEDRPKFFDALTALLS